LLSVATGEGSNNLLGNALICGVMSGPHDRYGARMVWIATLTIAIAWFRPRCR
jgi:hypothetical protein